MMMMDPQKITYLKFLLQLCSLLLNELVLGSLFGVGQLPDHRQQLQVLLLEFGDVPERRESLSDEAVGVQTMTCVHPGLGGVEAALAASGRVEAGSGAGGFHLADQNRHLFAEIFNLWGKKEGKRIFSKHSVNCFHNMKKNPSELNLSKKEMKLHIENCAILSWSVFFLLHR